MVCGCINELIFSSETSKSSPTFALTSRWFNQHFTNILPTCFLSMSCCLNGKNLKFRYITYNIKSLLIRRWLNWHLVNCERLSMNAANNCIFRKNWHKLLFFLFLCFRNQIKKYFIPLFRDWNSKLNTWSLFENLLSLNEPKVSTELFVWKIPIGGK